MVVRTITYEEYTMGIASAMIFMSFVSILVHVVLWRFSHTPKPSEEQPNMVIVHRHSGGIYAIGFFMFIGILLIMRNMAIGTILLSAFHH